MREAEKELKARVPRSTIRIDWKSRVVFADDTAVFKQEAGDLTGVFSAPFSDLSV